MGRCPYEAEILSLYTNTAPCLQRWTQLHFQIISVPWELELLVHFSENGHSKCLHKILLWLHNKHKHFASLVHFRCLYAIVFECISSWAVYKPSLCKSRSNLCCQHRWDFLDGRSFLPDWLSLSVSQSEADYQSNRMHTYKEMNWALEKPNYLQVNCKTFIEGELPLRMDWEWTPEPTTVPQQ